MKVIYARQPLELAGPSMFLAGPTPRARRVPSWRPDALRLLEELSFAGTAVVPESHEGGLSATYDDGQVHWEWQALEQVSVIVFWVPRDLKTLPGFTTNVEFGLYCRSAKALLGFPKAAPKMRYLKLLAERFGVPVFHDLRELLQSAVEHVK